MSSTHTTETRVERTWRWRTIDIIVAAVLAVVFGLLFWLWGQIYNGIGDPVTAVMPGFQGILTGPWLLAGPVAAVIIRKPGAAIFVELVAAMISALLGNSWGAMTLVSGLVQGLGAELGFAAFAYRRFGMLQAVIGGALAGLGAAIFEGIVYYPGVGADFLVIFFICTILSGAIIAGLGGYLLAHGLAKTGALQRFEISRTKE